MLDQSKMGGLPDLRHFIKYPKCDICQTNLNFVIQIYKIDFPEFYFPEGKDVFQLFRCPNRDCKSGINQYYDQKVFPFFFNSAEAGKQIPKELANSGNDFEREIPECELKPEKKADYPTHEDYEYEDIRDLEVEYGEKLIQKLMEKFDCIKETKCNGYACWDQDSNIPLCECGKDKQLFFQLSSDDREKGIEYPQGQWSPHKIMIGDVGKIYFFVCKNCGEKSVETRWDCG
jgi:uncharacterized protein YwqG